MKNASRCLSMFNEGRGEEVQQTFLEERRGECYHCHWQSVLFSLFFIVSIGNGAIKTMSVEKQNWKSESTT